MTTQAMPASEPDPERFERLARELATLGTESRTERKVKRVLPWAVSLAMHAFIVVLSLFVTWTVANLPRDREAIVVIADFNALAYEPVARTRHAEQTNAAASPAAAQSRRMDEFIREALADADVDPLSSLTGSVASGAELADFAPRSSGGATFVGLASSNARKIAYVIDASGSMISSLQIVNDELQRSLDQLSDRQSFAVIYFQGKQAIEVPPPGRLAPASARNRSDAMEWIRQNVVPAGGTNPLVAIERALALEPDVIFLLSQNITGSGLFEVDQRELLALLDSMNPRDSTSGRRRTQINCIQFLDHDPLNMMERIAAEHGGPNGFKFIPRQELGIGNP